MELKPCPFCGVPGTMLGPERTVTGKYKAVCSNSSGCELYVETDSRDTEAAAAAACNRRVGDTDAD